MAGSRSFSEHLSGLGLGIINRPMAAISKRFNSTTLATKIVSNPITNENEKENDALDSPQVILKNKKIFFDF